MFQNNIALKRSTCPFACFFGFGTIQNNIALKPSNTMSSSWSSFGTIQNNIALKPRKFFPTFRNRATRS
ncbi:hypothetical protein UR08_01945 [Listeria kieliensis]|uniref:Uncharacterized protein n=1 Tax=Listeria kieliensis TaxID=1621700 RepID=A0A3D8TVX4_9LIST|nr:hypothetical protein UR08_01945 [Listeria kieliensis]